MMRAFHITRRVLLKKRKAERGFVAMMGVLIAIGITLLVTVEFGTSTNIDMMAAAN